MCFRHSFNHIILTFNKDLSKLLKSMQGSSNRWLAKIIFLFLLWHFCIREWESFGVTFFIGTSKLFLRNLSFASSNVKKLFLWWSRANIYFFSTNIQHLRCFQFDECIFSCRWFALSPCYTKFQDQVFTSKKNFFFEILQILGRRRLIIPKIYFFYQTSFQSLRQRNNLANFHLI